MAGGVLLRDSKNAGPNLEFAEAGWRAFLAELG
ncbi:MAG TPA: DUF397 domain-containing protein [Pseudonocardiaceae bacterium]|nr:DUF397 domain-containing protein [Pseudonocardiaceae bacterium]